MDLDVPFEALAHKGILHAAMYIKDSIVQKKIISEAVEQHPVSHILTISINVDGLCF